MPEGDTIFKAARTLHTALSGKVVIRFESVLPKLMRVNEDAPIVGRSILSVRSVGKWSVMEFSGDLFLLTHMLMNGSWHLYRSGESWQRSRSGMRLAIETADYVAVGFNVPIAEFHTKHSLARRKGFNDLGPDVLAPDFDPEDAGRRVRQHTDQEGWRGVDRSTRDGRFGQRLQIGNLLYVRCEPLQSCAYADR